MNGNDITNGNAYMTAIRRPSHLAVVAGGPAATAEVAPTEQPRAATARTTGYDSTTGKAATPRESGVSAVARMYDTFEQAVLPMVLASGVSGETAVRVAEAIMNVPALRKQAEGAFRAARVSAVEA